MAVYNIKAEKDTRCAQSVLQIKGDRHTQILRFHVDRYDGGVDLSEYTWAIQTRNAAGVEDAFTPEAVEVFENVVLVDWMIKGTVTAEDGLTEYELSAIEYLNDETTPVWRGGIGTISVRNNLSPSFGNVEGLTEVEQLILYVDGKLHDVISAGEEASSAAVRANAAADRAEPAADSAEASANAANNAATAANAAAASANSAAAIADDAADTAIEAINQMQDYTSEYALRVKGEIGESTGNPVAIMPDEGSLIRPVTVLTPKQAGSGTPAPDNVRPISGYDSLELTWSGKNLLENVAGSQSVNGLAITKNADGSMLVNGVTTTSNTFVNLTAASATACAIPPGKYIASGGSTVTGIAIICDGNILIEAHEDEVHFEIPETAANSWVRLQVWGEGVAVDNETIFPMIRLASVEDGGYEPYQSEAYSVQIGQTVYGGRMDWNTGVLTVDHAYIEFDGSEEWVDGGGYFRTGLLAVAASEGVNCVCSHYPYEHSYAGNGVFAYGNIFNVGGGVFAAYGSLENWENTLAAWKASGTPMQVAFKLAEPYTIQLTPHQMLALEGTNTMYGDGDINVKWVKPLETSIKEHTEPLIERIAALEKAILNG